MTFQKIVAIDNTGLEEWAKEKIRTFAEMAVFYDTDPEDDDEAIKRIAGADAILVSWRTPIRQAIIDACPKLKYIGMCCSLLDESAANVDVPYARSKGIPVLGVRDYGDEGLVEFIISELIRLLHGFGEHQWADKQEELTGKALGIIGMGTTGQMLKDRALAFGMKVFYYSRTRKLELENEHVIYLPLAELLEKALIVSTHVPKHTLAIDRDGFRALGEGKILVNTSLEPTFDVMAFEEWIKGPRNYAIMDKGGLGSQFDRFRQLPKVIYTPKVTGFTKQAEGRLSQKVIDNLLHIMAG